MRKEIMSPLYVIHCIAHARNYLQRYQTAYFAAQSTA